MKDRFDLKDCPECITCGAKTMPDAGIPLDDGSKCTICSRCICMLMERTGRVPTMADSEIPDWAEYNRRFWEEVKKLAKENGMLPKSDANEAGEDE